MPRLMQSTMARSVVFWFCPQATEPLRPRQTGRIQCVRLFYGPLPLMGRRALPANVM
jgi:hypothetical protein